MPSTSTHEKSADTEYQRRKKAGRRMSTIEFDVKTHERIHAQAAREQRTAAGLVRIAVERYLDDIGA